MNRNAVSLLRHDNYRRGETTAALERLLEPLGGMGRFVKPGTRVLLKPNLVFGRPPERAVNTHPEIVRAVALLCREAGAASIRIGDSPGYGSARAAMRSSGLLAIADELGLETVEFTPVEHVDPDRLFVRLELAGEILEADAVINLAKFKTHGQMLMSMAVKNMFGAVPGPRKFQWHYRAGRDKRLFARMLNEIALAAKPALSIVDAVLAMDGVGPGSGRARPADFLAAGADPWAVDAALMRVLGLEPTLLFTLAEAKERGMDGWLDAETVGDDPQALKPEDWDIPELATAQMHGTFVEKRLPWLADWLRARITPPPFPKKSCTACGHCARICPAEAIRCEGNTIRIDSGRCIRCYCCHELCQFDGMDMARGGFVQRLLGLGKAGR